MVLILSVPNSIVYVAKRWFFNAGTLAYNNAITKCLHRQMLTVVFLSMTDKELEWKNVIQIEGDYLVEVK